MASGATHLTRWDGRETKLKVDMFLYVLILGIHIFTLFIADRWVLAPLNVSRPSFDPQFFYYGVLALATILLLFIQGFTSVGRMRFSFYPATDIRVNSLILLMMVHLMVSRILSETVQGLNGLAWSVVATVLISLIQLPQRHVLPANGIFVSVSILGLVLAVDSFLFSFSLRWSLLGWDSYHLAVWAGLSLSLGVRMLLVTNRWLWLLPIYLGNTAILWSGSRGALIASASVTIFLLAIGPSTKSHHLKKKLTVLFSLPVLWVSQMLGNALAHSLAGQSSSPTGLSRIFQLQPRYTSGRSELWFEALQQLAIFSPVQWLTGGGQYFSPSLGTVSHNLVLDLALEGGLIALVLFGAILVKLTKSRAIEKNPLGAFAFFLLIYSLFNGHYAFDLNLIFPILALSSAMFSRMDRSEK